jgi:predicted PurR-regulated permease PerM
MQLKTIKQFFFLSLLLAITITFIWLIRDFLHAIFWAIVLAVIFYPLFRRWNKFIKNNTVSTMLTMSTIFLIIIIPLLLIAGVVTKQSLDLYQRLSVPEVQERARVSILENLARFSGELEKLDLEEAVVKQKLSELVQKLGQAATTKIISFGQNIFHLVLQFFVMLYVLFFLFKDGRKLLDKLMHVLPLGDQKEKQLLKRFASTTRATIKGTLLIGVIQGVLGGLLFWIAGIEAFVVWALAMAVLSVIPAIGPGLVWLPAAIVLLLAGNIWQGVLVLVGGALGVSLVDNILRPYLVGKDTQMPDALVLLSTLGGLAAFGIAGFVIGPIIAAFFLSMWRMFEEEYYGDSPAGW